MHPGDPTVLGWTTVLVYFLAAALCGICAGRANRIFPAEIYTQHRIIWWGLAGILLFLGVNKQLDLQTLLIQLGRNSIKLMHLADISQTIQAGMILGMAMGVIILISVVGWRVRHIWRSYWLLLLGMLFLARYIIVRAATFIGVPLLQLSKYTGGLRVNYLLEIIGTTVIALAALNNLRHGTGSWTIK